MSRFAETLREFAVQDSGAREEYASGMRRDTTEGKIDYALIYDGPLVDRYAAHLTKGAEKYGRRNWQLACSEEELERFKSSAARHFRKWFAGEVEEDEFAAVVFNMNAAEYVTERLRYSYTFGAVPEETPETPKRIPTPAPRKERVTGGTYYSGYDFE